jgi:hypothetical protein
MIYGDTLSNKKQSSSVANLDFRISPVLKLSLENYCETHIEKTTEAINNAIKQLVCFGGIKPKKVDREFEQDKGKSIRMNVRTHPTLKESLEEYCKKNGETITVAITKGIKNYIGFKQS